MIQEKKIVLKKKNERMIGKTSAWTQGDVISLSLQGRMMSWS